MSINNNERNYIIMWNRKEIKKRGKEAFRSNYGLSVGVSAISLAVAIIIAFTNSKTDGVSDCIYWIAVLFSVFVSIGVNKFFLDNSRNVGSFASFKEGFSKNCGKNLCTVFVMNMRIVILPVIILVLGMLFVMPAPWDSRTRIIIIAILAIIATIIATIFSYDYKMVLYILIDNPELSTNEVLELSKDMMYKNKMKAFIFDLSFLGWHILGVASCFILSLFYVVPYVSASNTELYLAIREEYKPLSNVRSIEAENSENMECFEEEVSEENSGKDTKGIGYAEEESENNSEISDDSY